MSKKLYCIIPFKFIMRNGRFRKDNNWWKKKHQNGTTARAVTENGCSIFEKKSAVTKFFDPEDVVVAPIGSVFYANLDNSIEKFEL